MYKRIIFFAVILSFWFIGILFFPFDAGYYTLLDKPLFTLPAFFITIIWIAIYFLNTLSFYLTFKDYDLNNDYYFIIIFNYLFNQVFPLFFFYFHNLYLSLISVISTTITSYFLYIETKKINKTSSYLLIPYFVWNTYLLVLFIIIFIIN